MSNIADNLALVRLVAGLCVAVFLAGCDRTPPSALLEKYPQPEQTLIQNTGTPIFEDVAEKARIRIRAKYKIVAHIAAVQEYSERDDLGRLIPRDYVFVWGSASDRQFMSNIRIRQSNRWFYWRWVGEDLSTGEVVRTAKSMANVHAFATDPQVRAELDKVKPGDSVDIEGELVDVYVPGAGYRATSLSRDDVGAGACEILRVVKITRYSAEG